MREVATNAWAGSSAAGTSAAVRLRRGDQLAPSSEEKVEKSCKLSRLKRRWSCPVDASKMGAGLPMVWPVSDCTCTIGDHVAPSSRLVRLTRRTSPASPHELRRPSAKAIKADSVRTKAGMRKQK